MNVGAQHAARRPIIRVSVPGLEQRTYLSFRARREIFFDFVEFEIRKISPFDRNDRGRLAATGKFGFRGGDISYL